MTKRTSTLEALQRRLVAAEDRAAKAETALSENLQWHRLVFENWAHAEWETDAAGLVVEDSPSWRAYTGQSLADWLGYGWLNAVHPNDRAYAERQWREAMAARRVVNAEFRLRSSGGHWRWTNVLAAPMRDGDGNITKWIGINIDIDDRKRAEDALRRSEQRQAFLLKFSDVLRPVDDPVEVQEHATRLLGEHIKASRVFYVLVEEDEDTATILANYTDGVPPRLGRHSLSAFSTYAAGEWRAGRMASTDDVEADAQWGESERKAYASVSTRAGFGVPLIKDGRLVALLGVNQATPRRWTDEERELAREVAERTWSAVQHARVEAALRRSEWRLRTLYESIDEAYSEMQVILNEEGHVVDWLHLALNSNFSRVTGIPDITGRLASDVFPTLKAEWFRRMDLAYCTGEPQRFETELAALGRWFNNYITRLGGEDELVLGVFSDITERKRAERTLRESEELFRQFGHASSDGLWIRDAQTLVLQYASDAMADIYGLSIEAMTADPLAWPALIVPEDREETFGYIERVKAGESVVHEFRIQRPSDLQFRWIRSVGFPLRDAAGAISRIAGISSDITEQRLLAEHQSVLLHELQHRVRNIMGMIRSMANRTADGSETVEDYRRRLDGRLLALVRVQALLTSEANVGATLGTILRSEVEAQAQHPDQLVVTGADLMLPPKVVEVLTLAFHELATNALKYGALRTAEGRVRVNWHPVERRGTPWLLLEWIEEGAPPLAPSTRRGFGSELIEARIPYELGGVGKISITSGGAHCHLELPLEFGESILETDAPIPRTTYGGSLDMTGVADMTGQRVLIVEDDYYVASDVAAAFRGAGADVLGPCSSVDKAASLLEHDMPSAAVIDLNLGGGGPNFELAGKLRRLGVKFVFLTGYDPDVIPPEMMNVTRLQKPLPLREVVKAVSRLQHA